MRGTALVYSSHDRSPFLHDNYIVQRALEGRDNKRILFLPMSETVQNGSEHERQEFSWGTFEYYFRKFRRYGLEAVPFFWSSNLRKQDVDVLWHQLWTSEVVILGGGNPTNGITRYKALGEHFDGEWGKFGRLLHERQARGLLTVGFSAGADQLAQHLFRRARGGGGHTDGFGLVRDVMVTLHHEPSRNHELSHAAGNFQDQLVFGLPNDAGINVDQGVLPSGNRWQVIEFITDSSWDVPSDAFHVKTRFGAGIDHVSRWGWHWTFRGGDHLVRLRSPDGHWDEAWMTSGGRMLHYRTREQSGFSSVSAILAAH